MPARKPHQLSVLTRRLPALKIRPQAWDVSDCRISLPAPLAIAILCQCRRQNHHHTATIGSGFNQADLNTRQGIGFGVHLNAIDALFHLKLIAVTHVGQGSRGTHGQAQCQNGTQ